MLVCAVQRVTLSVLLLSLAPTSPLPAEKLRDPMLLERRCRVCAWTVPGCPGCWTPATAMRGYSKHGADKAFNRTGGKEESHGAKGSFAPSAVSHTHLIDREAVEIYRRSQCFVNVYVSVLIVLCSGYFHSSTCTPPTGLSSPSCPAHWMQLGKNGACWRNPASPA